MMRSMTGVGQATAEAGAFLGAVAVRSLNHRFLDLSVRCPRSVALLEPDMRERVQARLARGRVEVTVRGDLAQAGQRFAIDTALATSYVTALREIARSNGLSDTIDVAALAQLQGVVAAPDAEGVVSDEARTQVLGLLDRALDALDEMRSAEGRQLASALARHLGAIESVVAGIASEIEGAREARRAALREKGRALCQELSLDENRLYVELARLVDRCDVAEEIDRLRSHATQARSHMERGGGGKTLDFLAQEMMREANTIGSKSTDAGITHRVVRLKTEIERFREQVQNVE